MRLKLTLEYDGSDFHGWARQPGLRTVEGVLREALPTVLGDPDGLAVAGRTDTGVHALGQVVSLDAASGPPPARIPEALNAHLPDDLSVVAAEEVAADFHARFTARSRSYVYRLHRRRVPSPFERRRSWWWPRPLEVESLQAQAALLPGEHDFRAFTPTETQHDVFTRVIERAVWVESGEHLELPRRRGLVPAAHGAHARRNDARRDRPGAPARGPPARATPGRPLRPGASTSSASTTSDDQRDDEFAPAGPPRYDRAMRFPVVLFDLDGTLIDSGAIILDSFRHAARTVLDVELTEEALLASVATGRGSATRWRRSTATASRS